jgi:hypothetical protein
LAASSTERAAAVANMSPLNHGQLILSIIIWDGTLAYRNQVYCEGSIT